MKRQIIRVAPVLLAALLLGGCKEVEVLQPVPLTYVFAFDMEAGGSTAFADSAVITADEILDAIDDQLDSSMEREDIRENTVESLSYVLRSTDQHHAILSGDFVLDTGAGAPISLIHLENVILGDILDLPQPVALGDSAVADLEETLDAILSGDRTRRIEVYGGGRISHRVERFRIEVHLTLTHVVEQTVDVLDPL